MKKFFSEFKEFIAKGNVIDLAVGVIIGGAFSNIVKSLVENIITPLISLLTKNVALAEKFVTLDGSEYATLAEATEAGAAVLSYGVFVQGVIDFLITAFVIFIMVKVINKIRSTGKKEEVEEAPTTKACPFCKSEIAIDATRCPNCTSEISAEVNN